LRLLDDFISADIEQFFETNLDKSVYAFVELLYKNLTEKEIKCILSGTELRFMVDELFGPFLNLGEFSEVTASLLDTQLILEAAPSILSDMFFFYGGIYTNAGKRKLFEELQQIWTSHRNIIYRLSGIILLHITGAFIVKENLC